MIAMLSFLSATLYATEIMGRPDDVQQEEITDYKLFRHVIDSPVFLDTIVLDEMLVKWEAKEPESIELQSAKFQYLFRKALLEIEMSEDPLAENTAMLPKIPGLYENLQITNYWILQDKGHAMENYQKAYEILDQAIAQHPARLDLLAWRIDGYMQKFEHRRGMLAVLEMLQRGRQNGHQWKVLYDEAAGLDVEESFACEGVVSLLEHNEVSLAEILADTLLNTNPRSINYRRAKGALMESLMQKDSALTIYEELYREAPDDKMVLLSLCSCLNDLGRMDEILPYAEKLASNPDERVAVTGQRILAFIEPVDWQYDKMKQWMQEHADEFTTLRDRFVAGDETLTNRELARLYYGQAFTEGYSYLAFMGVTEAYNNEEYENCLKLCNAVLEKTPAALTALYYGSICAKMTEDAETFANYMLRARQLSQMLGSIGNASDADHAIPVLWVAEEYTIVEGAGSPTSQALLFTEQGPVDQLTLSSERTHTYLDEDGQVKVDTKSEEQDYYFNVTYPMHAM